MIRKFATCAITLAAFLAVSCNKNDDDTSSTTTAPSGYTGSGSVSQAVGTTSTANLFPSGQRVAAVGTVASTDGKTWTIPAATNYNNSSFPWASDLYNSYVTGHKYATAAAAVAALPGTDIVEINSDGDVYTAYIWADNYFEMYVNGKAVGKDPVPYTDFNACIVRFKVKKPFTMAIMCVDWEENLGTGTENNNGNTYHIGDGGFVAVIKDASGNVIAKTDDSWKAQTYYTAPIADLTCLSETGGQRLSGSCNMVTGSATSYAIHWEVPSNWYDASYDENGWPAATTFTNATVGVDNKPSYTNFPDVFDDAAADASFIWSTNLLLDNLVLLRKTVN